MADGISHQRRVDAIALHLPRLEQVVHSNDDRYRGPKGLRTVVVMNEADMKDPGLGEFDLVDVLCGIADVSTESEQPVTKHLVVELKPARTEGAPA